MRWKKIDKRALQDPPSQLNYDEDQCFYARELLSEGYDRSPDNQMIWNYKKSTDRKGKPEWSHKEAAIRQFASELSPLFKTGKQYAVTTIPSSKTRSDPAYDARLPDTIVALQSMVSGIIYHEPIVLRKSVTPSHQGGSRVISELRENYKWIGFSQEVPRELIIIDDVITSGSHFKAYQKVLTDHCNCKVYGLFWALTRNPLSKFTVEAHK